jgi:hypothetical protein
MAQQQQRSRLAAGQELMLRGSSTTQLLCMHMLLQT